MWFALYFVVFVTGEVFFLVDKHPGYSKEDCHARVEETLQIVQKSKAVDQLAVSCQKLPLRDL